MRSKKFYHYHYYYYLYGTFPLRPKTLTVLNENENYKIHIIRKTVLQLHTARRGLEGQLIIVTFDINNNENNIDINTNANNIDNSNVNKKDKDNSSNSNIT